MDAKPWWKSRTLWVNFFFAALTAVEANMGLLREHLGAAGYVGALSVVVGVNAVLRTITSQPITLPGAGQ